jgi:hypothetical protein
VEVGEYVETFRRKTGGGNASRLAFANGREIRDFGVELDRRFSELDFDFLRRPDSLCSVSYGTKGSIQVE